MSRPRDLRRFRRLYRLLTRQRTCVYCGLPGTTIDHFVPLSVVAVLLGVLDEVPGKVLVPACGECNSIAGSAVFPTIAAKRRYIQSRLRKRYRRLLEIPHWSHEELDELGYSLQDFVRSGLERKQWLLARLSWRNTSNSEAVKLAAVRSPFKGVGRSSAAKNASSGGTINNASRS